MQMTAAVQAGALFRESALASDEYREGGVLSRTLPGPARGLLRCLSRMSGNLQVRFLGGGAVATSPCYPAVSLITPWRVVMQYALDQRDMLLDAWRTNN